MTSSPIFISLTFFCCPLLCRQADSIVLKTDYCWWSRLLWSWLVEPFCSSPDSAVKEWAGVRSQKDLCWGEKCKSLGRKCLCDLCISAEKLLSINVFLCFIDFFQAWRRYDTDRSGYIEANELKVCCKIIQLSVINQLIHWLYVFTFCSMT